WRCRPPRRDALPISSGPDASAAVRTTTQTLFWDEGNQPAEFTTNVYDRDRLKAGNVIDGPAIVEQFDSTTIIGPGQRATVDRVRSEEHTSELQSREK